MVFSSIPGYLDPPNNRQQQQSTHHYYHQHEGGTYQNSLHLHSPLPPSSYYIDDGSNNGAGTIRHESLMSDRAKQAKLPNPEAVLKCARCESTNTKFCYFNNHSLTQPRHFCKTCRRYWTRGGALRSVPVGSGSRRNNKRSCKRSKSPATSEDKNLLGHLAQSAHHQFSFLPSLQPLSNFNSNGLGFGVEFHSNGGIGSILSSGFHEHWRSSLEHHERVQQGQKFPFLANLETPISIHGLDQFEGNRNNPQMTNVKKWKKAEQ